MNTIVLCISDSFRSIMHFMRMACALNCIETMELITKANNAFNERRQIVVINHTIPQHPTQKVETISIAIRFRRGVVCVVCINCVFCCSRRRDTRHQPPFNERMNCIHFAWIDA